MEHHLYLWALCVTSLLSTDRSDDDHIDRLNRKITVYILLVLAVISGSRLINRHTPSSISCWNRANFPKAYIRYTEHICFLANTYRIDPKQQIPSSIADRKAAQLNYYQWTPFIILLMGLCFYIPRLIWRVLSVRSGIDLLDIINAAGESKTVKEFEDYDHLIKYIVDTIDMYVDDARRQQDAEKRQSSIFRKLYQLVCCMTGKFLGNYFITLYLFTKVAYILNVILQIMLLNLFLGTNFLRFGFESVKLFRYGLNQPDTKYFPRETFCDFYVREPLRGGEPLQRITVQCVLTVNLFNQQIFTLLWIWYIIVFILNIYSLIVWISRLAPYNARYTFIHSRLARTTRDEIPRFRFDFKHVHWDLGDYVHESLVRSFITDYLEPDGFFFIRLLTANVSDFVVQEVVEQLWASYITKYGETNAKEAEESYYKYRKIKSSTSITPPIIPSRLITNQKSGITDAERKFNKQYSDVGVGLLSATSVFRPALSTTQDTNEQV